jgi:hypothetical protein
MIKNVLENIIVLPFIFAFCVSCGNSSGNNNNLAINDTTQVKEKEQNINQIAISDTTQVKEKEQNINQIDSNQIRTYKRISDPIRIETIEYGSLNFIVESIRTEDINGTYYICYWTYDYYGRLKNHISWKDIFKAAEFLPELIKESQIPISSESLFLDNEFFINEHLGIGYDVDKEGDVSWYILFPERKIYLSSPKYLTNLLNTSKSEIEKLMSIEK